MVINYMKRKLSIVLACLGFFALTVSASQKLEISNIKMPKVPQVSSAAAIYLSIKNHSDEAVILSGVSTKVAARSMLHQSKEVDGVAKMLHLDELKITAGGQVNFVPGGYHIMLMGVDKAKITQAFEVTLKFANHPDQVFRVTMDKTASNTKCPCCEDHEES